MEQPSYSRQLVIAFNNVFDIKYFGTAGYVGNNNTEIRFSNYNFNPVFLRISCKQNGSIYEVPSLINNISVQSDILYGVVDEVICPLSVNSNQIKRTSDSIFKYLFQIGGFSTTYLGLNKVTTHKGDVYYGAPGLILNSSFEPIMIGISEYKKVVDGEGLNRHVLKVSPNVFMSNGIIEKAIIKKLIPFYTSRNLGGKTVKVEIDDISKYIVRPVPPKANVQKEMKEILHTYKEDIINYINL